MLSIYVGNKEIILAQGRRKSKFFHVEKAAKVSCKNCIESAVSDLYELMKKNKIKHDEASFVLDSQFVTIKFLQLSQDDDDIEAAVNLDLRLLGVDKRYHAVSYKEFGYVEVSGKLIKNIMVVIAQKEVIMDCIELAHSLGLSLKGIEVGISSLDKIVGGTLVGCNVLLTSHDEELFVTLYKDNQMLLTRHIESEQLLQTISLCQQFLCRIDKNLHLTGLRHCLNLPDKEKLINLVANTFSLSSKQLFCGDTVKSKKPLSLEEYGFIIGALDTKCGINLLTEFSCDTSLCSVKFEADVLLPSSELPLISKRLNECFYLSFGEVKKFGLDKKL